MKKIFLLSVSIMSLLMACIGTDKDRKYRGSTADTGKLTVAADKPTAANTIDIPGLDSMVSNNTIYLTANDRMQYSDTLFKVKAGEKVNLRFKNIGMMPKNSMGHNVVVLSMGADFQAFVSDAIDARDTEYIPQSRMGDVVAHTRLVGPGEEDKINFVLREKGVYDFLCSFPGHYGSMRGKIVAE